MPWNESDAMTERSRFVLDYDTGLYTMAELCRRYGVSRETGYKWWHRYERGGVAALADQSRRPLQSPHRTPAAIERLVVATRRDHPSWGPNLIVDYLARQQPELPLPAASTAGAILKRHGLVRSRRRRRPVRHPGRPYLDMAAPNDVWSADFKGEFKTRDGRYCYPLTIADGCSRYLLACQARATTHGATARPVFVTAFREYGLPRQLLTDNGAPFAGRGLAGLSRLAVWWIRLGIHPVRIEPGQPQQNGRHERMHRTLKAEGTRPAAATLGAQQRVFHRFRHRYNEERPHHALGKRVPAEVYHPSARAYPERVPPLEYPAHFHVRQVGSNGGIKWHDAYVFVGRAFTGQPLGFDEVAEAHWSVYLGSVLLGKFDEQEHLLHG